MTAVAIAELGKLDPTTQKPVTSQPYTVGVLFSSSNASTWTAHQTMDLAFRLLAADYTQTAKTVDMGSATVSGMTDFLLFSAAETPSAAARVAYKVTLPDNTVLTVDDGQPVRLPAGVSGAVKVAASLAGTKTLSPVLWPGAQLVSGKVTTTADYVSRACVAKHGTKCLVIYDALLPSGSSVTPTLRQNQGTFGALAGAGTTPQGDGWVEFRFEKTGIVADTVQLKLALAGTAVNRPRVRNIRILVI